MSEMTASRKLAVIVAGCAMWIAAAWFLWRTRLPGLRLPHVDPRTLFSARELARANRHERVLDWLWVGETAVQLGVLGVAAAIARFPLRGPRVGRAATA